MHFADFVFEGPVSVNGGSGFQTGQVGTVYTVPRDLTLTLGKQEVGRLQTSWSVERWSFPGVAGQQVRLEEVNVSASGVAFDLTGPGGWVGFSNVTGQSDLINLPVSGTYTLTVKGTGVAHGTNYTFRLQETPQIVLTPGGSYTGHFVSSGQAQLFIVQLPSAKPMLLTLRNSGQGNCNELYARLGSPPTRGRYDYRFSNLASASQQIMLPMASAGTWYVLVYGESVVTPSDYTLEVFASDVFVTQVTPNRHGDAAPAVLTITGAGFDATTLVELVAADGTAFGASQKEADSFSQITATFAVNTVPPGTYSVRVSKPGGDSDTLTNVFEMVSGGQARLETNLIAPTVILYHGVSTIYVEYRNVGTVAMPAPLLVLTATQNGQEGAFLTLDSTQLVEGSWTSADPEGFSHSIQILASGDTPGVLQPGESFRVPVYYAGWQQPWGFQTMQWTLGVLTADNTEPVDWASLKESMRPASIGAQAWDAVWASFTSQVGSTWGDYVRMLDENATYLGRLGEWVTDVGDLLAFEFMQADGLSPLTTLSSSVDAAVEAPGLPLVFSRSFPATISGRFDLGPLGRSWSDNWQYTLEQATDGTVTVVGPGDSRRVFQPDSRYNGKYFSQPGDHGTLTALGAGVFSLRESAGLLQVFRSDSKLDYIEDTNGNRITCGYNGSLLTNLTHSSGQSLQIAYNTAGRIQTITDHLGHQTTFTYDGANEHLTAVQYYDGRTVSYAYDGFHALTAIAYPNGSHRSFTYDAHSRLAGTSLDGGAEALIFAYNTTGLVTVTDALGKASKFYFDYHGLLAKSEDALGNAIHMTFDDYYNLTRLTDPAGRSYTYTYDAQGNLTKSTDAMGHTTQFSYTKTFNRLASVLDANGNRTTYAHDTYGNLSSITYADGSNEDWAYDSVGNATSWTNRRGNPIAYTYDAAGRITSKTYADGSHVDYTYDARGNLITATDATGTTTLTYDTNDYLTRIDYPGGQWLQFTYDVAGRRASSLDQLGHRLDYHYDAVGRLDDMTDELGTRIVDYDYDLAGRLVRKTVGNGVYTTYAYDAAGQLLHLINYSPDGTILSRFDYTYDSRGRRTSMNTSYGLWTYEYDDLGQLTHAVLVSTDSSIPNQDLTYVYDALGNRIRTIENTVTTEYTTNNLNKYTQTVSSAEGETTYVFDLDGNLIEERAPSGTTVYTCNDENRLVAVARGGDTWQYTYNSLGNRVATSENGLTTRYVIDPIGLGNVVGEYDSSGNLIAQYDHGFGLLSRTDATGNPAYYTFDGIGNAQQLVVAAGAIANTYAYAPFGSLLRSTETVTDPFQFVAEFGVMAENNGLDFMRARYLNTGLGVFGSEDPLNVVGGDVNMHRYVHNQPTLFIDPIGLREHIYYEIMGPKDLGDFLQLEPGRMGDPYDLVIRINAGLNASERLAVIEHERQEAWFRYFFPWADIDQGEIYARELEIKKAKELGCSQSFIDLLQKQLDDVRKHGYYGKVVPRPSGTNGNLRYQSSTAMSTDPNQKSGPGGFGESGFISNDSVLAYRTDFENEATAAAPAQIVTVADTLDSNLDWSTFELTEIGFADQLLSVPGNSQHFDAVVLMSYNGVDFEVHIEAGIRHATGQVYASFYSIDPETSLPPAVDIGFLPPEDGTGRGMGYFSYVIRPKAGLATGTEIRNVALVQFDWGEIIATNQVAPHDPSQGTDPNKECLNTIDAGVPMSQVNPLPAQSETMDFQISWSGQDDTGGSGIASYDIYVSQNGDAWGLWLDDTVETSATYHASTTGTYAFYTCAKDNVGHVEAPPAQADATTEVVASEVTVLGNDVTITDGDATPSATDGTDFGSVTQGGTTLSRTFTARNDGGAVLTLGAVTVPTGFTLAEGLSTTLAAGASDTFTVQLDTATPGTKSGDVSFATNDADENPFHFAITGTVDPANLALGKTAVASTSYTGFPASNVTDGNTNSRWSSQYSENEWLYVDLGSVYAIDRVVLRWETAYGRGYKLQVSNDTSTWSDVYTAINGDGGVDDLTLSAPGSGRYLRLLGTQRATPFGYSLYELEVYGGLPVNHAPVVSTFRKSLMPDTPLAFTGGDFTRAFTDPDASDSLQTVKITSLPGHGVLMLDGAPLAVDQEILVAQVGTLTYTPDSGYIGWDSFDWKGSDGSLYAANGAVVNLLIAGGVVNLALSKPTVASTSYSGFPASKATDDNAGSRWSSQYSDSQWIYVDLGSVYTIGRVVLRWETAYGRGYQLQVSNDTSTWSDIYTATNGDGGVDDLTLSSPGSGRYLRLLGTQRGTTFGYSLYELEVYGGPAVNHAPVVSSVSKSTVQDTPLPFAAADFTGAFTDPDAGDSLQEIKIASLPGHGTLTLNGTAVTVDQEIPVAQIGTLVYTPNSGYAGPDSFQWNGSDGSLYAASDAAVKLSINGANLALNKPAVASTSYTGFPASNATDGNTSSRWSSQYSDSQWLYVDLGSVYSIKQVVLRWETAYGRGYQLQVSNDASVWSDVYSTTTGDGGVDDITLSSPVSGRYVRLLGTQRATTFGYSLYELEVYG